MTYNRKDTSYGLNTFSDEEQDFIFECCNKNLLMETNDLVELISYVLCQKKDQIRAYMWKEGYRQREEIRVAIYLDRLVEQVARDTGFHVEQYEPSPELLRLLEKMKQCPAPSTQ